MPEDSLFTTSPFNCAIEFRNVFKRIQREWLRYLDPPSLAVAYMVLDRTLTWGKEWEVITMRQFTDGIKDRNGEVVHPGLPMSHPTVRKSLGRLIGNGMLLTKERSNHRTAYAINLDWKPAMLRTPRNLKQRPTGIREPEGVNDLYSSSKAALEHGLNELSPEIYLKKDTTLNLAAGAAETVIAEKQKFHRSRSELEFTSAIQASLPNAAQCMTIWRDSIKEHFENAPQLSYKEKDMHILRAYAKRWHKAKHSQTFGIYLAWCVKYWRAILFAHFRRMTDAPQLPAIGFFVALSERFEIAFSHKAEMEKRMEMTHRDKIVDKLKSEGMPQDIAEREADERTGQATKQRENEKEASRILLQREALRKERGHLQAVAARISRPSIIAPSPKLTRVLEPEEIQKLYRDMPEDFGPFQPRR